MRIISAEGLSSAVFLLDPIGHSDEVTGSFEVEKFRERGRALLAPENGSAPAVPGVKLHVLRVSKVVIPHRLRLDTLPHSKGAGAI
ncbi:hypothetical protein I6F14_23655 [Bradyrhizobium sp. IC3069]|uniref:hypothetical protein n=1 Tax=unclassified Bradyrhizobium TaxID=2631580 RepID=UPI001CD3C67D|nr:MULTISPECIES: hypothetical protein [unclassified Bradyrhizobium]MCA1363402.1 hypothetical protein [Bradyrhizobium sp. IC4059]MCA1520940.1 hypothetical protein [Bradyrhizobium sp. IC3069]